MNKSMRVRKQLPNYSLRRKIDKMAAEAIERNFVEKCELNLNGTYLWKLPNEEPVEHSAVAVGTLLMKLLEN